MRDINKKCSTGNVSYFRQILGHTKLSGTDDIIMDIRELLNFNTRLDIDVDLISTNVNPWTKISITYNQIEPILNMEIKHTDSSRFSCINIFFSAFPLFDDQGLKYFNVYVDDGKLYIDHEHVSIDTIDEFSTELYLNKLITELDVHVDINTFKRILKLCYDVLMNRIPIRFIDFTDDKIFQGNLIDFLEYVI